MIGTTVQHYRILEKLGSGGMGVVYKAEDLVLNRLVALKFLPPERTRDPGAKLRFVAEARAASSVEHPNICTIHEIADAPDGQLYIVMSCYGGGSLKEKISKGAMRVDEALRIAAEAAHGLAKAHSAGIIHRDIKPANVMLSDDGHAKVVDFGLAKLAGESHLTETRATVGTIAYMSPEQARGDDVDERTDIWSLGVVLHEMLAGELPFKGDQPRAYLVNILKSHPARLTSPRRDIPREVEKIVEHALEKSPGKRFASMGQFAAVLQDASRRLAAGELRPGIIPLRLRGGRARTVAVVAAGVLTMAAAGGILEWSTRSAAASPVSIAVFPIRNESGDAADDRYAEGITDALYTDLMKIRRLKVAPMDSVRRWAATNGPLAARARELHVTWVVEGSVLAAKTLDQVRIRVSLTNAATAVTVNVWEYKPKLGDVLDVLAEFARGMASEVNVER